MHASSVPALQASGLRLQRGQRAVLQDIDLTLPAGRWLAVVGPNGAGKSTLLHGLAGLLPCAGRIQLLGDALTALPARERARRMAWLGQSEVAAGELRVRDVVMLGRLPHQPWLAGPSAQDHAAVQRALQATHAWDWRDRPLGQLSGGERQRVLMARALATESPVLLLDEPLNHLDPPHQADCLALMRRHARAGGAVISVLHELSLALQADDMLVLKQGRVLHHGPCASQATHHALQAAFDGRVRVHAIPGADAAQPQWAVLPSAPPAD